MFSTYTRLTRMTNLKPKLVVASFALSTILNT